MANNHGFVNTAHCVAWDSDANKLVGIYKTADLDNGTFVVLSTMNVDGSNNMLLLRPLPLPLYGLSVLLRQVLIFLRFNFIMIPDISTTRLASPCPLFI